MEEPEPYAATQRRFSRGQLLKKAGAAGAVAALPAGVTAAQAPAAVERMEQLEYFAAEDIGTIDAIVARLIPTDANGPGATEARVARYIDRALAGELSTFRDVYTAGLAQVESYSRSNYGAAFTALTADQQDTVLRAMERANQPQAPSGSDNREGTAPRIPFPSSAAAFFEVIREHTLQGMFGDPYHGGNANYVGWNLLGFAGIKLAYSAKEQQLNTTIKPARKSTTSFDLFAVGKARR
jgi:gluconate 2-dehydrogenase gamma chain